MPTDDERVQCFYEKDCIEHIKLSRDLYKKLTSDILDKLPDAFEDLNAIVRNTENFNILETLSGAIENLTEAVSNGVHHAKPKGNKWYNIDSKTLIIFCLGVLLAIKELAPIVSDFSISPTGVKFIAAHGQQPTAAPTPH